MTNAAPGAAATSVAEEPASAGPDGAVRVANEHGDSITVLDPATGEVIATLTGIDSPHNAQGQYDAGRGLGDRDRWCGRHGCDRPRPAEELWVTSTGTVLPADQGSAEDPGQTLSSIDGSAMTVTATVEVGSGPHGITVDPAESRAWVEVGDYPNGITYTATTPKRPE